MQHRRRVWRGRLGNPVELKNGDRYFKRSEATIIMLSFEEIFTLFHARENKKAACQYCQGKKAGGTAEAK